MKTAIRIIISLFIILFTLMPGTGFSSEYAEYLPKWMELLQKGNEREKKLALNSLWFLEYPEFRKDIKAFDPILNALTDKNPSIREAAAASLKQIGKLSKGCCRETQIVPTLIKVLEDDHPRVRKEAAKALGYYKDERAVDSLIKRLGDKDPWVKLNAVFALGELRALEAVDPLLKLLEDDLDWRNKFAQQECVVAIREIGEFQVAVGIGGRTHRITPGGVRTEESKQPREVTRIGGLDEQTVAKIVPILIRKSEDPYLKNDILKALVQFRAAEAENILLNSVNDPDERIRKLVLGALSWLPEKEEQKLEILRSSLKDPSASVRALAAAVIGSLKDPRVVDPLTEALRDSDHAVQLNAIKGLAQFKDEKILEGITSFLGSDRMDLHQAAGETFMSVVRNSTKERVYVYRKEGLRYVSKNRAEIPREVKTSERLIHPKAVGNLLDFIDRSDQKRKLAALDLIRQFEDKRIERILLKLLDDPSPQLRGRAISLAPNFFDNTIVPRLIVASKDQESGVREKAVKALGEFEDQRALVPLMERLSDAHPEIRVAALDSLRTHHDPRISDQVIKLLRDDSLPVRRSAVLNIKARRDTKAIEALALLLNDMDYEVANFTVEALAAIGDRKAVLLLTRALKGEFNKNRAYGGDVTLRMNAAKALGSIKDRTAVPALIECLSDENPNLRRRIVSALKEIRDPAGLEAIKDIPKDTLPPEISSATPPASKDFKPPSPSIRKEPLPGSGYSLTMFGRHEKKEEKPPPPKEEQPTAIPTPPPTSVVTKYDPKPRPSIDIKPLFPKLKANAPNIRRKTADSLGDPGNQEATDYLIPLLRDKDEYVRQAAARALGKLRDRKAVEELIVSLKDPDVNVRAFSTWALGEIQDPRAIEPLSSSLSDREEKIRDYSFEALRKFREPMARTIMVNTLVKNAKVQSSAEVMLSRLIRLEGQGVILKALEDPSGDRTKTVRNYINLMEANIYYNVSDIGTKALEDYPDRGMVITELSNYIGYQAGTPTRSISLLGSLKDRRALPILLDALKKRKDSYYRLTVINAIGDMGDKEAEEPLLQILVDDKEYPGPRMAAARTLGKLGDARAVEPLLQILKDERANKEVRRDAAFALGTFRDKRAVEPLVNILKNNQEDIWLRVAVAGALGNIGDERAIEPLEVGMKDPSDYLRHAVEIALRKIKTGK